MRSRQADAGCCAFTEDFCSPAASRALVFSLTSFFAQPQFTKYIFRSDYCLSSILHIEYCPE